MMSEFHWSIRSDSRALAVDSRREGRVVEGPPDGGPSQMESSCGAPRQSDGLPRGRWPMARDPSSSSPSVGVAASASAVCSAKVQCFGCTPPQPEQATPPRLGLRRRRGVDARRDGRDGSIRAVDDDSHPAPASRGGRRRRRPARPGGRRRVPACGSCASCWWWWRCGRRPCGRRCSSGWRRGRTPTPTPSTSCRCRWAASSCRCAAWAAWAASTGTSGASLGGARGV